MRQNTTQRQTIKWQLYHMLVDAVIRITGQEDVDPEVLSKLYDIAEEVITE